MLTTTITTNHLARRAIKAQFGPLGEEAAKLGLRHLLEVEVINNAHQLPHMHLDRTNLLNLNVQGKNDTRAQVKEVISTTRYGREENDVPSIDALRLTNVRTETPSGLDILQELDGVQPRLLEISCGWDEFCSLDEFSTLRTPFPLETLILSGACRPDIGLKSTQLAHITSLRLHLCCSIYLPRFPPPLKLRRLVVEENDIMDTICRLAEDTHMLEELEELVLIGTNGCDLMTCYELEQFLSSIQKMPRLRVLQISERLPIRDYGPITMNALPQFLPQALECFRFWSTPGAVTDHDPWTQRIRDRSWLPNLKEFIFSMDMKTDEVASKDARPPWERSEVQQYTGEKTTASDIVSFEIGKAMTEFRPGVKIAVITHG
ncbi:hypothetical protein DACRYDRAFT_22909 [Dacryopinax primogenitus]|uniref:F-box domain-containing protein n=1 Tax=Dacryopinax primogenitus (strain DJM 731) TaxID=1858805 RepID=M5FTY4_DACPD|nr:uncharacterized protein DACRYDRAFT_22909 [Dacryopinax primogenitus]EJU01136.1 hypothetical protein DACRYDRAFT_22909 [Dacryopinax primogenitus]